ncbi:MAG: hypothetical protein MUE67_07095 [Anaerolineales bacterium]|jgi:hypothetical protein|nr:hypothetical protein [Anaerolineales bacterium]
MTADSTILTSRTQDTQKKNPGLWRTSLVVLLVSLTLLTFSGTIANIDLWSHLKIGLDNLSSLSIARSDPYSYLTEGRGWINHEWLAQILFALAWKAGQVAGLVLLKLLLGLLTLGIIFHNFRLQHVDLLAGGLVLFVGSILLASDFSTIYPQIFTLPMLALLVFLLLRAEEGNPKLLWVAPPAFLLWANLHGGFLVGLALLVGWVVMHLVIQSFDWRKIVFPAAASLLATLVTPYGLSLYQYLLRSSSEARPEIWVWASLNLISPFGILYLFLLTISIVALIYSRRHRSPVMILLLCVTALMPFLAKRHLSLFAIVALLVAGEHIAHLLMRTGWMRRQVLGVPRWVSFLTFAAAAGLFLLAIPNLGNIIVSQSPPYPVQAVQIIKNSQVQGNIATEYNWGGYIIWHLGPGVKVSVDGRRETVYSTEVYEQNLGFLLGLGRWDQLLDDEPTDMVLVNDHTPIYNLMKLKSGWTLIYSDTAGDFYVRQGSPLEAPLRLAVQEYVPIEDRALFP